MPWCYRGRLRDFAFVSYQLCPLFIYTTALPFHSLIAISCSYDLLELSDKGRIDLKNKISYFLNQLSAISHQLLAIKSDSAIQCVIVPGNENVKSVAHNLQEAGFDVRPILYPTVPKGSERLRICLHAFNTEEEIDGVVKAISYQLSAIS